VKRSISIQDAASCIRLIEECGELWADAPAWQQHLADGFERLVGGSMSLFVMTQLGPQGPEMGEGGTSRNSDPELVQMFEDYRQAGGLKLLPELPVIAPMLERDGGFAYRQSSLVSRADYYRSELYDRFMARHRLEDFLSSAQLCPGGGVVGLSLHRHRHETVFSERDEAVAALLIRLVGERVGFRLSTRQQAGRHRLTPRQQQVLDLLLEGASDKEIATSLRISQATAHEHVVAVFRCFGVRSRPKLLGYFIRRSSRSPVTQY